jgi:hypothetical protein
VHTPIDPFFTSAASQKQRPLSTKLRRKFVRVADPADKLKRLKRQRKGGRLYFVNGGPALVGFKPSHKVWDEPLKTANFPQLQLVS